MKKFCAAPWFEGVFHNNGTMFICCRNQTNFGDWKKNTLKDVWFSDKLQTFRRAIAEGRFPDKYCKRCFENGTARSLHQELEPVLTDLISSLKGILKSTKELSRIAEIQKLFGHKEPDESIQKKIGSYFDSINELYEPYKYDKVIAIKLDKLKKLGLVLKAYMYADLTPDVIAPFRQVNLISRCNARCIHCSISNILTGRAMDEESIEKAFSFRDSILDFFLYGSEIFLYKKWKEVAHLLADSGVKLSLSTNGILFNPGNIRYLIDNKLVKDINISIDGASCATVESIRVNVDFNKLISNIEYLFYYADLKKFKFNLTFSFVLMKRNYKELPDLIRLLNRIRGERIIPFSINCQALENLDYDNYINFVHKEHHSLVDRKKLVDAFSDACRESKKLGIPVTVFYSIPIEDFANRGFPFPPLSV